MTRTKKKNWLVTIAVLVGVALLSAMNAEKVLEYKNKVPGLKDLGTK